MPNARLTVKAMETWMKTESNKSIVDAWDLTTPSDLYNKDVVLYTIMKRGGSLEVLEYDPDLFYTDCAMFWAKWRRTVEKWVNALGVEYEPLNNYDKTIDSTMGYSGSEVNTNIPTGSEISTTTKDGSEKVTETPTGIETNTYVKSGSEQLQSQHGAQTERNNVSAFDETSDYAPKDEHEIDQYTDTDTTSFNNRQDTNTLSFTSRKTETETQFTDREDVTTNTFEDRQTVDTKTFNDRVDTYHLREVGNIGVTTSQQMLKAELELQYWNLYDHIADLFIGEMTTRVY